MGFCKSWVYHIIPALVLIVAFGHVASAQNSRWIVDGDGDGVPFAEDACPYTAAGVRVGANGCAPDDDGDGVPDVIDRCEDTPKNAQVDAAGCQLTDEDDDGVMDDVDICPTTQPGAKVKPNGCAIDSDRDGIADGVDDCANTPSSQRADEKGCSKEQLQKEFIAPEPVQVPETTPQTIDSAVTEPTIRQRPAVVPKPPAKVVTRPTAMTAPVAPPKLVLVEPQPKMEPAAVQAPSAPKSRESQERLEAVKSSTPAAVVSQRTEYSDPTFQAAFPPEFRPLRKEPDLTPSAVLSSEPQLTVEKNETAKVVGSKQISGIEMAPVPEPAKPSVSVVKNRRKAMESKPAKQLPEVNLKESAPLVNSSVKEPLPSLPSRGASWEEPAMDQSIGLVKAEPKKLSRIEMAPILEPLKQPRPSQISQKTKAELSEIQKPAAPVLPSATIEKAPPPVPRPARRSTPAIDEVAVSERSQPILPPVTRPLAKVVVPEVASNWVAETPDTKEVAAEEVVAIRDKEAENVTSKVSPVPAPTFLPIKSQRLNQASDSQRKKPAAEASEPDRKAQQADIAKPVIPASEKRLQEPKVIQRSSELVLSPVHRYQTKTTANAPVVTTEPLAKAVEVPVPVKAAKTVTMRKPTPVNDVNSKPVIKNTAAKKVSGTEKSQEVTQSKRIEQPISAPAVPAPTIVGALKKQPEPAASSIVDNKTAGPLAVTKKQEPINEVEQQEPAPEVVAAALRPNWMDEPIKPVTPAEDLPAPKGAGENYKGSFPVGYKFQGGEEAENFKGPKAAPKPEPTPPVILDAPDNIDYSVPEERGYLIRRVHFGHQVAVVDESTRKIVMRMASVIRELAARNPKLKVELVGHAGDFETAWMNDDLSLARAESTKVVLQEQGIAAGIIAVRSAGANRPLVAKNDLEAQMLNRRVEIRVIQ